MITGFDLQTPHPVQNVINATPAQAAELFAFLYPRLSWPEIARLMHRPDVKTHVDCEFLLTTYGMKSDERFLQASDFLMQWPAQVQDYISEKDIRPVDITIIDQLSLDVQKDVLSLLVTLKPSKTLFCQMLDLCGELILIGAPIEDVIEALKSPKALEELRKKRFPVVAEKDDQFKNALQSFQWPKAVSAQALRKGDLQGVEIKFFVKDASELEKMISGLQNVASTWKQKNEPDPTL